jgi:hypothetical protein
MQQKPKQNKQTNKPKPPLPNKNQPDRCNPLKEHNYDRSLKW